MKRDPAFLFYSKDWLEGTAELYPDEKGVYIDLLAHQHQKGFLPTDTRRLAKLCGISEEEFLKIWETIKAKFERVDNRTLNRRLEQEMFERAEKGKKNTVIGTFASLLRKGKYTSKEYKHLRQGFDVSDFKNTDTERLTERLTEWIDKRLKSIEDGDGNENGNKDVDVDRVYSKYPTKCPIKNRSTGKGKADKDKITRLFKTHSADDLILTIDSYITDCKNSGAYMKNFSTFLNNLPEIKSEPVKEQNKKFHYTYEDFER